MFQNNFYVNARARKIGEQLKMVVSAQDITNLRREIAKVASNGDRYDTCRKMVVKTLVPAQEGTLWKEGYKETRVSIDSLVEQSVLVQQIAPVCDMLYVSGNRKELIRLVKQFLCDNLLKTKNDAVIAWIANKCVKFEEFYSI